jgi:phenylacetate-CoA ligase
MTVEVEIAPDAPSGAPDIERKSKDVQYHIKTMIGVTCGVAVKVPGEVPRSQGKAVRVKDLRKKAN